MTHKYDLKPTPATHPVRMRPWYGEIRDSLAVLETVALGDLRKLEAAAFGRRLAPSPTPAAPASTPVDMTPFLQPSEDQGEEGSCGAFAGCHAQGLCEGLAATPPAQSPVRLSPAGLYWNTRVIMGTTDQDSGSDLGDVILAQEQTGTPTEALCPYVAGDYTTAPDATAVADEANHKAKFKAYPLDLTVNAISQALTDGNPVFFGFEVWQAFEDSVGADGMIPDPDGSDLGGHAQLFYCDPSAPAGTWPNQNSWGQGWGCAGRGRFPQSALSTITEAYALVPLG